MSLFSNDFMSIMPSIERLIFLAAFACFPAVTVAQGVSQPAPTAHTDRQSPEKSPRVRAADDSSGSLARLWGDGLGDEGSKQLQWDEGESRSAAAKDAAPQDLRWAVLRCSYPDSPPQPLTASQTRRMFEKPNSGLFAFFDRQSRGMLHQQVDWVADIALPQSRAAYWSQVTSVPAFLSRTTADCLSRAPHNLDGVTAVAVFLNDAIDCCAYGGPYTLTLPGGGTRRVPGVWLPPAAHAQPILLAHEMLHGLNIGHSNNSDGDASTTDNWWDVMSNINANRVEDAEIGPLPRGLHAYHRQVLGWLAPEDVTDVDLAAGDDRSLDIELDVDSLARLHATADTGWVLSFRSAGHADEGVRTEPAVFIDELDVRRPQALWVVDDDLPIPTIANTPTSYFTHGESWVVEEAVPGRALMVEVLAVSSEAATVRVHLGPPPPPVQVFCDAFESAPLENVDAH